MLALRLRRGGDAAERSRREVEQAWEEVRRERAGSTRARSELHWLRNLAEVGASDSIESALRRVLESAAGLGESAAAVLVLPQPDGEPTRFVAERVRKAYDRAIARQGKVNDHLQGAELEELCAPDEAVQKLLHAASFRLGWSARAYHRVLKVARTIADLAESGPLATQHVAEAIQYRRSLRDG